MRLRIEVTTRAAELPWDQVLRPGRGLVYNLLAESAPELGARLHNDRWGPHRMVPFGHGAPTFPKARRRPGVYTTGGPGYIELGSPISGMTEAWLDALSGETILDWGGTAMRIRGLTPIPAPRFPTGRAEFRTATPVVIRPLVPHSSDNLLPYEEGFTAALEHNLRRKAETLDLDPDIGLDRITWIGAKRSFTTRRVIPIVVSGRRRSVIV